MAVDGWRGRLQIIRLSGHSRGEGICPKDLALTGSSRIAVAGPPSVDSRTAQPSSVSDPQEQFRESQLRKRTASSFQKCTQTRTDACTNACTHMNGRKKWRSSSRQDTGRYIVMNRKWHPHLLYFIKVSSDRTTHGDMWRTQILLMTLHSCVLMMKMMKQNKTQKTKRKHKLMEKYIFKKGGFWGRIDTDEKYIKSGKLLLFPQVSGLRHLLSPKCQTFKLLFYRMITFWFLRDMFFWCSPGKGRL